MAITDDRYVKNIFQESALFPN